MAEKKLAEFESMGIRFEVLEHTSEAALHIKAHCPEDWEVNELELANIVMLELVGGPVTFNNVHGSCMCLKTPPELPPKGRSAWITLNFPKCA